MERTEIGMNKIIKVSNLSRDYSVADKKARNFVPGKRSHKTISAVKSISFEIGEGETVGFIGPNGAGKSTLMSVLFGLYQPEKGIIKKNGQEVKIHDPNDATALGIGMVHQAL